MFFSGCAARFHHFLTFWETYYRVSTLVMTQVRREEIPHDRPRIKRGIPVILLGQLGIDIKFQGQGLGDLLLRQ